MVDVLLMRIHEKQYEVKFKCEYVFERWGERVLMSPRKEGSTKDLGRGKRIKEILENIFPEINSRTQKAKALGFNEANLRSWESGSNIDNRALAKLLELGVDIGYILTGEKSHKEVSDLNPAQQLIVEDALEEISETLGVIEDAEKRLASARCAMKHAIEDPGFAEKAVDVMAQEARRRLSNDTSGEAS
jgi:hypothetical protein